MKLVLATIVCLLPCCSFAQNITPIYVLPTDDSEKQKQGVTEKKFNKGIEILVDPASGSVNQEEVTALPAAGRTPSPKNIADLANKISSAKVEQFGGEAGALRVRLRGARTFEPTYYFNGLPLAGAGASEQVVTLVPISAIANLLIYPDAPPFWLNSMGISGDINIVTCQREDCFSYSEDVNLFKAVSRFGSYQYWQNSLSHALKLNKQFKAYTALEYSTSKENYKVFNNNNSVLNSDNGIYQDLENNDFKKVSGYLGFTSFHPLVGKVSSATLFTDYNKGIPGSVGSSTSARLKKQLFLTTVNTQKLYISNGIEWNNQLGFLLNESKLENFKEGFSSQANEALHKTIQVKSWLTIPTQILAEEKAGLSLEYLNFSQKTSSTVPAAVSSTYDSQSNAVRHEYRLGIFESGYFPISSQYAVSANVNGWLSFANADTTLSCNDLNLQANCNTNQQKTEKNLFGYLFSLQHKYENILNYLRYSVGTRRPYLAELYGAPGGILANTNLSEEKSQKIEFGFLFPFAEIGVFQTSESNLIFLQDIGKNTFQYQNIESSRRQGVFLSSDYYFLKHWRTYLTYQYLNAKILQGEFKYSLPRSAEHSITSGTSLENIYLSTMNSYSLYFGAYVNLNWQSEFYLDYLNINKLNVPPIYNSGFSFQFKNSLQQNFITLAFDMYNIANETFATVSNNLGYSQQVQTNGYLGYPPPGRRFYLTISGEI